MVMMISGFDGLAQGAKIDAIVAGRRRIQMDRPIQELVPLEVNLPPRAKEEEVRLHNDRPKQAAKADANWRMKLRDQ